MIRGETCKVPLASTGCRCSYVSPTRTKEGRPTLFTRPFSMPLAENGTVVPFVKAHLEYTAVAIAICRHRALVAAAVAPRFLMPKMAP